MYEQQQQFHHHQTNKLDMRRKAADHRRTSIQEAESLEVVDLSGMSLDSLPIPSINLGIIYKLDLSNNNLQVRIYTYTYIYLLIKARNRLKFLLIKLNFDINPFHISNFWWSSPRTFMLKFCACKDSKFNDRKKIKRALSFLPYVCMKGNRDGSFCTKKLDFLFFLENIEPYRTYYLFLYQINCFNSSQNILTYRHVLWLILWYV